MDISVIIFIALMVLALKLFLPRNIKNSINKIKDELIKFLNKFRNIAQNGLDVRNTQKNSEMSDSTSKNEYGYETGTEKNNELDELINASRIDNMYLKLELYNHNQKMSEKYISKLPCSIGEGVNCEWRLNNIGLEMEHAKLYKDKGSGILRIKCGDSVRIYDEDKNVFKSSSILSETTIYLLQNLKLVITPLCKYKEEIDKLPSTVTLEIISGKRKEKRKITSQKAFCMGSIHGNDVIISNKYVSKNHLRIEYDVKKKKFVLINLSKTNPAYEINKNSYISEPEVLTTDSKFYIGSKEVMLVITDIYYPVEILGKEEDDKDTIKANFIKNI